MTIWETLLEIMISQMIETGVPRAIALERAMKAIHVVTKAHHGERVLIPRKPRPLQPLADELVVEMVTVHGLEGTASSKGQTTMGIRKAMARNRVRRKLIA